MVEDGGKIFKQQEQGFASQDHVSKHLISLYETISSMGNPFEDDGPELLVLDFHSCTTDGVVDTMQMIKTLGLRAYQKYVADVNMNRKVTIHQLTKKITMDKGRI